MHLAGFGVLRSLEQRKHCAHNWPLLAGWVSSPMAASEQSSSLNVALADGQLSGNRDDRFGHEALIGGCWKQPFEPSSEPTTVDLLIAAVGGAEPQ